MRRATVVVLCNAGFTGCCCFERKKVGTESVPLSIGQWPF